MQRDADDLELDPDAVHDPSRFVACCAAAVPVSMFFSIGEWVVVFWGMVSLATAFAHTPILAGRRRCCTITAGFALAWIGLLFCGWSEPPTHPELCCEGDVLRTSGLPIPAVTRLVHDYPDPPAGAPSAVKGSSIPCFGLDLDWVVFVANLALLTALAGVVVSRLPPRVLRILQLVAGIGGAVAAVAGALYLSDGYAYSFHLEDIEHSAPK